jgi:hypothetical protein
MPIKEILMNVPRAAAASLSYVIGLAIGLSCVTPNRAETIFFDDFSDGSVTNDTPLNRDANPVIWTPLAAYNQGTGDAASGDYVLTTNSGDGAFISIPSHSPLSNTSVRAQMRILDGTASIGVFARADTAALTAYQAGISLNTGNAYIVRNTPDPIPLIVKTANVDVSSGDVVIQFDAIGETLQLFLWNAGSPKPSAPFIEIQDSTLSIGVSGIILDSATAPGSGVFRFFHVADAPIPEPSTVVLSVIALIGLIASRRNTRALRRA